MYLRNIMKYKITFTLAVLLAAGTVCFSAEARGPYDFWGYSGRKPAGIYCALPGPHGERPGMDRYSPSVLLVSVDPDMKKKDMERICRKYDLSILYEYRNFSMYALKTEKNKTDEEMDVLIASLEKEKGILTAERDRMLTLM